MSEEFENFKKSHELQLYSIQFPAVLEERLHMKLKYQIYDIDKYFEILDNQNEERYLLRAKQDIKKEDNVFLIDHAWTFQLRDYKKFCKEYPNMIKRACNMCKYAYNKRDVIDDYKGKKENVRESFEEYQQKIFAENIVDVNFDDYDIGDDKFENIGFNQNMQTVSLENNKIENVLLIHEVLDKHKNVKAIWCRDNVFCDINENYEKDLEDKYNNLQIINSKLTKNASEWAIDFIIESTLEDKEFYKKYIEAYGKYRTLNLSGREPFNVKDLSIFKNYKKYIISGVDLRDNSYDYSKPEMQNALINFLKNLPKTCEKLLVDECSEGQDIFNSEDTIESASYNIFMDKALLLKIQAQTSIKYINNIPLQEILKHNDSYSTFLQLYREYFVMKNMWSIIRTYRIVTDTIYEPESTYYIMDEYGSAVNHSDSPNFRLQPIIFSGKNDFKADFITYSLLWPKYNIKKGDEVYVNFMENITENEERSSRLTVWCNTPKYYFMNKFKDVIAKFNALTQSDKLEKFNIALEKLNQKEKDSEISDQNIKDVFDFSGTDDDKLIEETLKKIKETIHYINNPSEKPENILQQKIKKNEKIILVTDLDYLKNTITLPNFQISRDPKNCDILWLSSQIYTHLEDKTFIPLPTTLFNQFPYEAILVMKSKLFTLLQNNIPYNNILTLTYDMKTELAEIIGNYYFNEDNCIDNTNIMKPISMARSVDMPISDNLDEIIRLVETGPKIAAKYIDHPLLMNGRKFDLRFIVAVRSFLPLDLFIYDKMFWVRSSNKEYCSDTLSYTDYECHFTVMNYNEYEMKTIYDKDFKKYLEDNYGNVWDDIYAKIKNKIKTVFNLALKDCPMIVEERSRSIYGIDVMIDEEMEPYIIEINYQPDCKRATMFVKEFYNDVFKTLFFGEECGMIKL